MCTKNSVFWQPSRNIRQRGRIAYNGPWKISGAPPRKPFYHPFELFLAGSRFCSLFWPSRAPPGEYSGRLGSQNVSKKDSKWSQIEAADPHKTCAGMCGSHIGPSLERSFFAHGTIGPILALFRRWKIFGGVLWKPFCSPGECRGAWWIFRRRFVFEKAPFFHTFSCFLGALKQESKKTSPRRGPMCDPYMPAQVS